MAASLILFPFALRVSGAVATADQNSAAYVDSQLQTVVLTRLGEREMCESFGVPDAAFTELTAADIQTCLDSFGPDGVDITDVRTTQLSDNTQTVDIEWEWQE